MYIIELAKYQKTVLKKLYGMCAMYVTELTKYQNTNFFMIHHLNLFN